MNEVNTLLVIKVKANQGIAPCFRNRRKNINKYKFFPKFY